ncbi:MAG: SpoIIE family protein phosphatase [Acidobacteria bacterium]|nr:SpoIIE family protein phosphatase [Acidobacteriota bacterium]
MEAPTIRLVLQQPSLAPTNLELRGPVITLGRASDCTVPIRDRYLSRHHAEIAFESGAWLVRDRNSANGTLLNNVKVDGGSPLRPGDRIVLGDTQIVFDPPVEPSLSQIIPLDTDSQAKNLALPAEKVVAGDTARAGVLASLALEFIEDRPMDDLFEFILSRVVELLHPSRAALALLGAGGSFEHVHLRRRDESDSADLYISRTLLGEVIEGRNVISFVDTSVDEKLARAQSIIAQDIRSAVCAPLLVGDAVLGVLYLDFLSAHGSVTQDDVRLIAQIARFAAAKLETTRLREEAIAKAKLDEELRTAYTIQSRLLPVELPSVDGYDLAGSNRPCRTVSGDFYDFIVRPDGRMYFIIADVSGKGITAALVMASLATAFDIFVSRDPDPAELVSQINKTLAPKTAPTKFVTLVAGVLDPRSGTIDFTNAGHVPPLLITASGVERLASTDMIVGLFAHARYRTQRVTLAPHDSLVLFTDGVTEAENADEEQLGLDSVATAVATLHGTPATRILDAIDAHVQAFAGHTAANDDVTLLAVTRNV